MENFPESQKNDGKIGLMSRNKIEATLKLETFLTAPSNIQHSDLAEMSYCDETYQMK